MKSSTPEPDFSSVALVARAHAAGTVATQLLNALVGVWVATTHLTGVAREAAASTTPSAMSKRQPSSYNCSQVGSCVRSVSNGCNWLGVNQYSSSYSPSGAFTYLSCRGPSKGLCTWYSDPFCTQIIAPGGPPQSDGGMECPKNASEWASKGPSWCKDAYDYPALQKKPANCPDVTEKQNIEPPWYGPWTCLRSCQDKGNYVRVRRSGKMPTCLGPYADWVNGTATNFRCSWCELMSSLLARVSSFLTLVSAIA